MLNKPPKVPVKVRILNPIVFFNSGLSRQVLLPLIYFHNAMALGKHANSQ